MALVQVDRHREVRVRLYLHGDLVAHFVSLFQVNLDALFPNLRKLVLARYVVLNLLELLALLVQE